MIANYYTCFHPRPNGEYQKFPQKVEEDRRVDSNAVGTNPKYHCERYQFFVSRLEVTEYQFCLASQ